ncbi:MAG TPA: condensation domain-containing protein, partial [Pyrinomonadaceae bacterium]
MRVECGEVEQAIREECGVSEAVVVAQERGGERRLVAYVVRGSGKGAGEIKGALGGRLPEYMIPVMVKEVEEIPLTRNGKVDRSRLAKEVEEEEGGGVVIGEEAKTPVEEVLAGVWIEVLGVREVRRADNFFELGGHSLLATQLLSRVREIFQVELQLHTLFDQPTMAGMAAAVESLLRSEHRLETPPIEAVPRDTTIPLSFAQQRLWFLNQLEPDSTAYHISNAVRLTGPLNLPVLEQTLTEIVKRHEVLRTAFAFSDRRPVQIISPPAAVSIPVVSISETPEAERETEVRRWIGEDTIQPFDLSSGPLFRAGLLQLGETEHVLLLTMHHIISDAWSLGLLVGEMITLYQAFSEGKPSPLAELPIQYADFAHWQREWLSGEVLDTQLGYWKKQLAGAPSILELPTDRPRPPVQSFQGAAEPFALPANLSERLEELSRQQGVTLFMMLLAAFQVLLSRYSAQQDIVVGSPIANRNHAKTESLIGFFVNTLVLRTDLSGNPSFKELLGRVREVALGAYTHQDVPFEMLVEELQPERKLSHSPLFQVVFALQNAPLPDSQFSELTLDALPVENDTSKFDVVLNMSRTGDGMLGMMEYNTDLFDGATIRRMLEQYQVLLEDIAGNPEKPLAELSLVTEEERQELLLPLHSAPADFPSHRCLHHLFEDQVRRHPLAIALAHEGRSLSYLDLNRRANQLARFLISHHHIGPGSLVAICLHHSFETFVALLAVLKTGAAYVPFDPLHPPARLAFMLEDSNAALLLTEQALQERFHNTATPLLTLDTEWQSVSSESDADLALEITSDALAYVIYTSGSTGQPKGVAITNRSLVNYVWWAKDVYVRGESLSFALYSSLAFDLTVTSLYVPLV